MDNTEFNKMLVTGKDFPEDRMINFAAHLPAPMKITSYADDLASRAKIETQGNISTLSVGDSAIGWFKATKDVSDEGAQWIGRRGAELGHDQDAVSKLLAMQLVCSELTEAAVVRNIRQHDLTADDILEAVMYPGASLTPIDEDDMPELRDGDLMVHGYTPAPDAYFDMARDLAKTTITNDEQSFLVVGSKEIGFLAAVRNEDSGVWESHSEQYPGYNICHSADKSPLDVAKELCSDLAVFRLEADDIAEQIISHGLQPETLDFVEVMGTSHVINIGDGYQNMPDPDGVFRNILGRLGGHDPA